jgi:hypothetical protein
MILMIGDSCRIDWIDWMDWIDGFDDWWISHKIDFTQFDLVSPTAWI